MSKYSHFEMCEKIFGQKYKWNEQKHDYEPYSRTDMWNKMIEQQDKIADLETKLAESETQLKEEIEEKNSVRRALTACNRQNDEFADMIKKLVNENEELKHQLEKSEKSKESYRLQNEQHHLQLLQFYSRLGVEAFGADIHEKALETLMIMKEQLAEKDKLIEDYSVFFNQLFNQDKISFAIAELEKVKSVINTSVRDDHIIWDFDIKAHIDNQIKQLKEKNNG